MKVYGDNNGKNDNSSDDRDDGVGGHGVFICHAE